MLGTLCRTCRRCWHLSSATDLSNCRQRSARIVTAALEPVLRALQQHLVHHLATGDVHLCGQCGTRMFDKVVLATAADRPRPTDMQGRRPEDRALTDCSPKCVPLTSSRR